MRARASSVRTVSLVLATGIYALDYNVADVVDHVDSSCLHGWRGTGDTSLIIVSDYVCVW